MKTDRVRVSVVRADDYLPSKLVPAISRGLALIGGIGSILQPGSRVFVKINHLSPPSEADRGIVTHPAFVESVLVLLKEAGAEITVGDDIQSGPEDGFQISGFRQMCERMGVRLINLREAGFVQTGCRGHLLDEFYISSAVLDADVIVNLPKLKTHSLTFLTGGVKNMYGVIPQGLRSKYHALYPRNEDFSMMLTDILSVVRPHLTIMDGITAMEGEGPANGKLRKVGVILASKDAVASDAVATRIVGAQPADVLTTRYSEERGLGVGSLDWIEVTGETLSDIMIADFSFPRRTTNTAAAGYTSKFPRPLRTFLQEQLTLKPRVDESRCALCCACEAACPVGAIRMGDSGAEVNRSLCMGCLCCNEVCRFNAITPEPRIIGRGMYLLEYVPNRIRARLA
jgi:uncharacterized protein (DUF362 family)/Pyruvate/2-oxoacid:ferredoxin oxidoreductase delta subunit